jgi:hippurate hydrolase
MYRLLAALMLVVIFGQGAADAQVPDELIAKVTAAVDSDQQRLVDMFKDIHANPEIGFTEVRTSSIVARELEALGVVSEEVVHRV